VKPENQFISNLHKHLDPVIHREKTANPYRRGMPDVYYEAPQGTVLWAEYKWFDKETVRTIDLAKHITSNQQAWLRRAHANAVPVAVVVGCPHRAAILFGDSWETPQKLSWLPRKQVVGILHSALLPGGTHALDNQRTDDYTP